MRVIETADLRKTFRSFEFFGVKRVEALGGVNLSVDKGEIFGLLGPNGAGKTTLVKILLGICYSSRGGAKLFGHSVRRAASRASVGYLPENHKYPTFLKGQQVMRYYAALSGMPLYGRRKRIDELLKLMRMKEWAGTRMGKYSKGMQQRVGMAVAMVADPELLVLDEPTDGVDPIGRKEIRDILLELKAQGKTIFLNSHLLSEVELVCDRIAILNKGKVVTEGSVDALTDVGNTFALELEEPPPGLLEMLQSKGIAVRGDGNGELLVDVPDLAELNAVIDYLRSQSILIRSIRRKRISLEDMFIDVIGKEGGAGVR
ncbi:MAG TPA: ABC transporter ATP-binding protein [Acidobacteriota bacterium]|nr:ABC transporter ATP-binding protein [Acidobacteriota bacterium]